MVHFFLKIVNPRIAVKTTKKIKMKNMILAMEAAPAAIPVKPKSAAIIAITRNTAVHFSMILCFYCRLIFIAKVQIVCSLMLYNKKYVLYYSQVI